MQAMAGIIGAAGALDPAFAPRCAQMVARLAHGAARVAGHHHSAALGLHVGWVAPDGCSPTAVPARSPSGRTAVILFGEGFSSHRDSGAPDTAAALADDFERRGATALRDLDGAFHGLAFDFSAGTVTLFNDRYGLGRVYYHEATPAFYFASEAKALLAGLPSLRELDPRGLAEWFAVGCVMQNRSLFRNVAVLPPASAWTFHRDGRIEKHRYFDPTAWEQQDPLDAAAYTDQLGATFRRIGRRYLGSGTDLALSLTGGLDSRAILAWSHVEPGALPCYTFGGPLRDCADVVIARRVAALAQQPHTTLRVGDDFFARFTALAERSVLVSDGTMDVSGAVELHVNQQARAIAPARLTGNYGSEILRSHVAFRPGRLDRSLFTPEFARLLDQAAQTYRLEAAGHPLTFIAFKQVPWHHQPRYSLEQSQLIPRSPYLDRELVALAYRVPRELHASPQPLLDVIAAGNPRLGAIATDRALQTHRTPLVSQVAHSWQEFTAKAEYAYDYGMPPWLARADRVMSPLHLEKIFLGRHKFYHFRVWYRDQLRGAVRDLSAHSGRTTEPFCYRTGTTRRLVDDHLSGRANRTLELHKLLAAQLIDRLLLHSS